MHKWMCVILITRLLRLVGKLVPVNWLNHTIRIAVVIPNDRPKSASNRCEIEVFGCFFVLLISCWKFCWYRGFLHRTESDHVLFFLLVQAYIILVVFSFLNRLSVLRIAIRFISFFQWYNKLWKNDKTYLYAFRSQEWTKIWTKLSSVSLFKLLKATRVGFGTHGVERSRFDRCFSIGLRSQHHH